MAPLYPVHIHQGNADNMRIRQFIWLSVRTFDGLLVYSFVCSLVCLFFRSIARAIFYPWRGIILETLWKEKKFSLKQYWFYSHTCPYCRRLFTKSQLLRQDAKDQYFKNRPANTKYRTHRIINSFQLDLGASLTEFAFMWWCLILPKKQTRFFRTM